MDNILGFGIGFFKRTANTNSCSAFINRIILVGSILTSGNISSTNGIIESASVTVT